MLSIENHRRDSANLKYVYPVVSRRAAGVSVGINLNVNNACNWACLYCQVDNLSRGGPPAIDLHLLAEELSFFLREALFGDFMLNNVPESARRLVDIAFSGNGEPTSCPEFAAALDIVGRLLDELGLAGRIPVRLITNGSLMHRQSVRDALSHLSALGGEVWFKLDRGSADEILIVNDTRVEIDRVLQNLEICASLAPTWVQTCWFALDGKAPGSGAEDAYCALLAKVAHRLAGVHLYGLARPSMQAAAPRLARLAPEVLHAFAERIQTKTGIRVVVSP